MVSVDKKKKRLSHESLFFSAGEQGFEPQILRPERNVMPFHHSPKNQRAVLYHAMRERASRLFARRAAGVILHVEKDQQDLGDRLQCEEVKDAGQRLQ